MARAQSTPLRTALSRMFPTALLKRLALSTGTVRRRRRVDPVQLFWVVVLTLGSGRSRTFADLRRSYERVTGTQLSASSFYNRFTPAFTRFLKEVLELGLEKLHRQSERTGAVWGEIRDVLCVDSTVIRLHDALASCWPACRTNHTLAAVKMHTVLNVRGLGPHRMKITSERVHDGPALRAGRWVKGRLLLFDLGYFRYALFAAIHQQGGFFLTRLKDNANPTLRCLHRRYRGRAWRSRDWDCARSVPGFAARSSMPRRRSAFSAEATLANAGRQRSVSGSSAFGMRRARSIIGTSPICRSISSKRKTSASSMPRAGPSNCYSGN